MWTHGIVLFDVLVNGLLDDGDCLLFLSASIRVVKLTSRKLELDMVPVRVRGSGRWCLWRDGYLVVVRGQRSVIGDAPPPPFIAFCFRRLPFPSERAHRVVDLHHSTFLSSLTQRLLPGTARIHHHGKRVRVQLPPLRACSPQKSPQVGAIPQHPALPHPLAF